MATKIEIDGLDFSGISFAEAQGLAKVFQAYADNCPGEEISEIAFNDQTGDVYIALINQIDIVSSFGQPVNYAYIDLMNDEVFEFSDYDIALEQVEALNPPYDEDMTDEERFELWFKDGNVHEIEPDVYTTQDAQWTNRIKGMPALKRYFKKEFS
jgi:hypothetical protein